MNEPSEKTTAAVEGYLDSVAAAMRRNGDTGPEVETAIESLREQIFEMAGRQASARRLDAVLATLEPPDAYGAPRASVIESPFNGPDTSRPRTSALAWSSVALAIGSWVWLYLVENEEEGGFFTVLSLLGALAAGIVSWRNPLGRFGALMAFLFLVLLVLIPIFGWG